MTDGLGVEGLPKANAWRDWDDILQWDDDELLWWDDDEQKNIFGLIVEVDAVEKVVASHRERRRRRASLLLLDGKLLGRFEDGI